MVPEHHGGSTRTTPPWDAPIGLYLDQQRVFPSAPLTDPVPWTRRLSSCVRTPHGITDFMGHLRRLMKELYEAGFCFKECIGLVDNFRITTNRYPPRRSHYVSCVEWSFLLFILSFFRLFFQISINWLRGRFDQGPRILAVNSSEIFLYLSKRDASFEIFTQCVEYSFSGSGNGNRLKSIDK